MRKICVFCVIIAFFAFSLFDVEKYDICVIDAGASKLELHSSSCVADNDIMAREVSIAPVSIFVFITFILIDSYFIKRYLWKAELPAFWGCKFRIQSPRCKLTCSNIRS